MTYAFWDFFDTLKLPNGNCDFAFRAKSPGGILCRPYTEGNLKLTPLPPPGEGIGAVPPRCFAAAVYNDHTTFFASCEVFGALPGFFFVV